MINVYQVKITLKDLVPSIWRQILVKSDVKLSDLHKIIQTVMGWTNSHLHQFVFNEKFYCNPEYEDAWDDNEQIDYRKIKLRDLLSKEKQKLTYEYDFGDGWEHIIALEKIFPVDKNKHYPICIDGARSCPPEDCGGTGGYEDLLEIIRNPGHKEYDSMIEWLGNKSAKRDLAKGGFDSEQFDINEINKLLKQKDYGCITLDD